VPGVRDLLTDGREGLIASSSGSLGSALLSLRKDPARRREMAKNARERALEFTAEKFAEKARAFYEDPSRTDLS
jgi:glycosyltransferase involved in cell wall biosynthesis